MQRILLEPDCAITGGGAKGIGLVETIEEAVDLKVLVSKEPLITGAPGAVLTAEEQAVHLVTR